MGKKKYKYEAGGFQTKICPICGKEFVPAALHTYKSAIDKKLVCSWSCVCESERQKHKQIGKEETK